MGDNADMILDGILCEETGEYIGPGVGYPRKVKSTWTKDTPAEAKIRAIRKELAILIKEKQATCRTDKEKNIAVNDARQEINAKYGKGWREEI